MLYTSCGIIGTVDNENELPDPIPENNIFFIKDTKKIVTNIKNGLNEYKCRGTMVPITSSEKIVFERLDELAGRTVPINYETLYTYTILEDGFYSLRIYASSYSSNNYQLRFRISIGNEIVMFNSTNQSTRSNAFVIPTTMFLQANDVINIEWVSLSNTSTISSSWCYIKKMNTIFIE
jgi:hypothetical protein